jgi:CSLREA domain-containing protein
MSKRRRRSLKKRRRHASTSGRTSRSRTLAGASATVGATLAMAGTAQATDFTVDNLGDTTGGACTAAANDCSLREAIENANLDSVADNILFDSSLSGMITLTSDELYVTGPTDIQGPGAGTLTVSGNDDYGIFRIVTAPGDPVTISGLTMTDGSTGITCGGAVFSAAAGADLTISDAVVSNSNAGNVGGICSLGPSLTVERSTVSGNAATDSSSGGGGIYARYQLYIVDSTISGNTAEFGGGVYPRYSGGTSPNDYHRGPHTIRNSTIVGNTATRNGGGVYFYGAVYEADRLTIESSTIAGNNALGSASGPGGYGGGVRSADFGYGYLGAVLDNTIVAGNTAANGDPDVSGDLLDASFSLIQDPGSAGITEGVTDSNIYAVDPLLAPLADNGGPTQTQALAFNTSPALDKGMAGALSTDQRGETRPFDLPTIPNSSAAGADGSDIGAVEMQSLPPDPPAGPAATLPFTPATVAPKCKGRRATVFARPGLARTLTGTNKRDVIVGTKRKDTIRAKGGNDLVCAKAGRDFVKGGGGKDKLYGQRGKDNLLGGAGKDLLSGGGKNDTCVGGAGRDAEKSC